MPPRPRNGALRKEQIKPRVQSVSASVPILDSAICTAYGPTAFRRPNAAIAPCSSRVSKPMTDDARETPERGPPSDQQASLNARFQRLDERLRQLRRQSSLEQSDASPAANNPSAIARGFRLSSELVAGVLVGAAIGWGLDHWLGISPWGMIVFVLLGFVAGVLNVMRAAGVVPTRTLGPPASRE
jgi:ATP synthase protein I